MPYVIGPIGGALPTPDHFEKMFNFKERLVDKGRSFFYFLMKKNFSWKRYFNNAYRIVIATEYLFSVFPPEVKNKAVFLFDVVIDVDEFKEIKLQRRRHFIKIVYSGRLISTKGILMLIEAIRILKEKKMSVYSKLKILILGDGPLRRVVDRLIKKHGLDSSVQLIGKVSREKVINTLKESDIYCLPTIREPGGGSILEAMAKRGFLLLRVIMGVQNIVLRKIVALRLR